MSNKAYEVVTERILKIIESGVVPWQKSWSTNEAARMHQVSGNTGHVYQGCNQFLLSIVTATEGFKSNKWLTFKQAVALGGNVKKGAKGTPIVYYGTFTPKGDGSGSGDSGSGSGSDAGENKRVGFLKFYYGFNASQCEGLPSKFDDLPNTIEERSTFDKIAACDAIIAKYTDAPTISQEGERAYYRPSADAVVMPVQSKFISDEHYYSVLFHELAHSTGHNKRLARPGIVDGISFGSDSYGKEELIAELAASFLCRDAGIDKTSIIDNSAAYLAGWCKAIKQDVKLIVAAAAAAQRAANWINGVANVAETAAEAETVSA